MARPDKVSAVQEITEKFQEADATLLTEYRGLRVSEMAELRTALRAANAEYKVLKNTLARIAVKELGQEDLIEMLTGPTAVVFVNGDVVEAAKALDDAVKKFPVLVVKGGSLKGGKLIDADQAKALAKLESREVLLTKIAMMLNQPAQQTVNVLSALLRDLGSMLAQVVTKKESGELPGGTGEPPAAEAPAEAPAAEAPAEAPAEAEAPAAEAEAEAVGVPSPEGDDAEAKAESAAEGSSGGRVDAEAAEVEAAEVEAAPEASTDQEEESSDASNEEEK